ncbi:hypothetical protein AV530_016773 [Patagioenas fasciata monilis]|uniref:Uncharacterized protein n=1 Tax=Patagioenas fasciata monilis TaxID=372326 RepID=A0A1V4J3Q6_PATFA|nr:hypothetical protein AV530_016773 [Patagioenas fasciata monilis]
MQFPRGNGTNKVAAGDRGIWDNSWSGLFIPVGNTCLYGLQDAVGGSETKRASNVKAPFEEEMILPVPLT